MRSEASYESKGLGFKPRNRFDSENRGTKQAWGENKDGDKKKYKIRSNII
jgi:hypothetical protein